jgi:hypothetical protein
VWFGTRYRPNPSPAEFNKLRDSGGDATHESAMALTACSQRAQHKHRKKLRLVGPDGSILKFKKPYRQHFAAYPAVLDLAGAKVGSGNQSRSKVSAPIQFQPSLTAPVATDRLLRGLAFGRRLPSVTAALDFGYILSAASRNDSNIASELGDIW